MRKSDPFSNMAMELLDDDRVMIFPVMTYLYIYRFYYNKVSKFFGERFSNFK